MRNVDIVIPGLFLPQEICADACAGLPVPFLEKMLARSILEPLPGNGYSCDTLEKWLCQKFDMERQQDEPIAPVTLAADGMQPGDGYWLRADPVHLQMRRTQLLLLPDIVLGAEEAAQLCASLNLHFNADGLYFFAPSPQRWYLRVEDAPKIVTTPLAQASGRGVQMHLPKGKDALRWHKIFNEIQMIFFEHEVNRTRETRGDLPVNSVWIWGGGRATGKIVSPYERVCGDSFLAGAFALTAGIDPGPAAGDWTRLPAMDGDMLVAWEGLQRPLLQGDLHAWRDSVLCLEQKYLVPLWEALRNGRVGQLSLDVPGAGLGYRFVMKKNAAWKLWRVAKPLEKYSLR